MKLDKAAVQRWLDAYVLAWRTYEPDRIRALFTEDATYRYHPLDREPLVGREAIVTSWLASPDAPGTWSAELRALALDGDLGIAEGLTRYVALGEQPERVFANLWVIRFAPDGRCREFTEWYMQPRPTPATA